MTAQTKPFLDYRLTLRLLSPLGSHLQSDTIFGHLCWQVAYGGWEGGTIDDFLAPFRAGDPPFVLSDGFPESLLPKPLCWRAPRQEEATREDYARRKQMDKGRFVSEADFGRICRGGAPQDEFVREAWEEAETLHAAIDRNTGTTSGEGNLFQTTALLARRSDDPDPDLPLTSRVQLYARCQPGWIEVLEKLLRRMAQSGFGRDKSVGLGAFNVEKVEPYPGFEPPAGTNGFVVLSSYAPASGDPVEGYYRLRTKYGKLSEIVSSGNPWKRPLLQVEPGACFSTPGSPRPWYGRLIENIAPGDPRAVQCGFALAAAMKMN